MTLIFEPESHDFRSVQSGSESFGVAGGLEGSEGAGASAVQGRALPAAKQFAISMAVAMGCYNFVARYAEGCSVKWPNDIYVGDMKIAGILIENTISGDCVVRSLCGVGLNLNQMCFLSDAPNPISLAMVTGREFELRSAIEILVEDIERELAGIYDYDALRERFMEHLYRRSGFYGWRDSEGEFEAEIAGIDQFGRLELRDREGDLRRYGFKEIRYLNAPNSFE